MSNDNKNVVNFSRRSNHTKKEISREQQVHRRRIIAITSVLVLVIIFFSSQIVRVKLSESETQRSIDTSEKKLKKEKADNADLKLKAKQLKSEDYIEKIIRAKYYYSKDGEQIYALPGSNDILGK